MNTPLRLITAFLALSLSVPAQAQTIQAVLRLQERVPLEALAKDVKESSAPRFGAFYTPAEIRELSAPAARDYEQLLSQLGREGFQVLAESPTHLWLSVEGDAKKFEEVFGARFSFAGEKGRKSLASVKAPARLSLIAAVIGLDNTRKSRPRFRRLDGDPSAVAAPGVSPATIKTAYGFNPIYKAGLSGKGQDIAIATYDGFKIEDITKFYSLSNISPAPAVDQVTYNGTPKYDENSATETELDAEFSGMIAPGAKIHVFASATNDDAGELQMFTAILDDNRAKVVNYSWGDCETHVNAAHAAEMAKVFARAVAQGVNIMVASGDSGSDSCQDGTLAADWPAANPDVVAVGGTTFSQTAGVLSESGWNGSGGGISTLWDLPGWQAGLGAPYVKRSYPDVSFNADPYSGQAIWATVSGTPRWLVVGGTSMAAPQWSGFLALVGEARAKQGAAALGFLNPIIYGFSGAEQASYLNDVTEGNNGAYSSGAAWDAVTGYGSMKASALLQRLVAN